METAGRDEAAPCLYYNTGKKKYKGKNQKDFPGRRGPAGEITGMEYGERQRKGAPGGRGRRYLPPVMAMPWMNCFWKIR